MSTKIHAGFKSSELFQILQSADSKVESEVSVTGNADSFDIVIPDSTCWTSKGKEDFQNIFSDYATWYQGMVEGNWNGNPEKAPPEFKLFFSSMKTVNKTLQEAASLPDVQPDSCKAEAATPAATNTAASPAPSSDKPIATFNFDYDKTEGITSDSGVIKIVPIKLSKPGDAKQQDGFAFTISLNQTGDTDDEDLWEGAGTWVFITDQTGHLTDVGIDNRESINGEAHVVIPTNFDPGNVVIRNSFIPVNQVYTTGATNKPNTDKTNPEVVPVSAQTGLLFSFRHYLGLGDNTLLLKSPQDILTRLHQVLKEADIHDPRIDGFQANLNDVLTNKGNNQIDFDPAATTDENAATTDENAAATDEDATATGEDATATGEEAPAEEAPAADEDATSGPPDPPIDEAGSSTDQDWE